MILSHPLFIRSDHGWSMGPLSLASSDLHTDVPLSSNNSKNVIIISLLIAFVPNPSQDQIFSFNGTPLKYLALIRTADITSSDSIS